MLTHDFTENVWGHSLILTDIKNDGLSAKCYGWSTPRPVVGDYVVLSNSDDDPSTLRTTRYQVVGVKNTANPNDMFFAELRFAPRTQEKEE